MKREKCEIRIPRSFERSHFLQLLLSPRRHGKFAYQIHAKFSSHRVGGNCVFETRLSSCRSIKRIRDWRRSGAKESCTCSFLGFLFLPPLSPSQKATAMHKTCNEDKSWHKIWQIVSEIIWQGGPKKKKRMNSWGVRGPIELRPRPSWPNHRLNHWLALPRLISEAIKAAGFWAVAHSKGGRQEGGAIRTLDYQPDILAKINIVSV